MEQDFSLAPWRLAEEPPRMATEEVKFLNEGETVGLMFGWQWSEDPIIQAGRWEACAGEGRPAQAEDS